MGACVWLLSTFSPWKSSEYVQDLDEPDPGPRKGGDGTGVGVGESEGELEGLPIHGERRISRGKGDSDDEDDEDDDNAAIARLFSIGVKRKRSASCSGDTSPRGGLADVVSVYRVPYTVCGSDISCLLAFNPADERRERRLCCKETIGMIGHSSLVIVHMRYCKAVLQIVLMFCRP